MGKKFIVLLPILLISIFIQSCKDPELNFEWFLFEAQGSYSSSDDSSYLKLNAWLKINQSSVNTNPSSPLDPSHFEYASVINWRFQIFSGDQMILELTDRNIYQKFNEIHLNVAADQYDYVWVAIESQSPLPGDIFNGISPDRVQVEMSIYDTGGQAYSVVSSTSFTFDRN